MQLLAIETSCDETAAAVVADTGDPARPWDVRSNIVASQVEIHRAWGGVVPELASRQHVRDICGVVDRALEEAETGWDGLDAIAVTQGPGLVGSLLVGVAFAKAAAASRGLPLVGVQHLAGHIESLVVEGGAMPLPAVVLVVSGGHTNLYLVAGETADGTLDCRLIGKTRDDAAGEAYDKVASLLGLSYPGGPVIDKLSRTANDRAVDFPYARMTHDDRNAPPEGARPAGIAATRRLRELEFSFSGLKTAVKRHVQRRVAEQEGRDVQARPGAPGDMAGRAAAQGAAPQGAAASENRPDTAAALSEAEVADICASFQRVVVETLLDRTFLAARRYGARSVGISGGVSANSRLRADAATRAEQVELPLFLPSMALATDNAAMIGAAGLRLLHAGITAPLDLNAKASLPL
ncbi:MAG: tRNA (adenosine(37)-N6)-threonylcarbamoyltransferase complex transferase subunit TsaD [Acidobacteria bacterium]|nr:tRNA (adenosine(37)-N6)-threonylcarbamoyltransferase complex transferase subunit TsaD [Acidobacteriota bacterium]